MAEMFCTVLILPLPFVVWNFLTGAMFSTIQAFLSLVPMVIFGFPNSQFIGGLFKMTRSFWMVGTWRMIVAS